MKRSILAPTAVVALGSVVLAHGIALADSDMLPLKASISVSASTSAPLSMSGFGYVMVADTILNSEHQVGPTTDPRQPTNAAPPLNTLGTQPFVTRTAGETTSPLMMLPKPPKS